MKRLGIFIVLIVVLVFSVYKKDPTISLRVWPTAGKQLEILIRSKGISPVMQSIAVEYNENPRLRIGCNAYTRDIGQNAYTAKISARTLLSDVSLSYCNYGLLIGYIGAVLAHSGNESKAMRMCRFLKDTPSGPKHGYMECLKGIGTGSVSTSVCERVTHNETELNICVVGVMNKLAENSSTDSTPFNRCYLVDAKYQPQCYGSMAGMTIWSGRETFESALALVQQIPNREGQIRATRIIAKISMNKKSGDLVSGCRKLPDYLKNQCFISLVQGAMELGTPGNEWKDGFVLCRNQSITDREKDLCIPFVLYQVEQVLSGTEKVKEICATLDPVDVGYCYDYQKDYFSL